MGQRSLYLTYLAVKRNSYCLILDEPFANLDEFRIRKLCEFLKELKTKMTLIIATNYLAEPRSLFDKIYRIQQNKIELVENDVSKLELCNEC